MDLMRRALINKGYSDDDLDYTKWDAIYIEDMDSDTFNIFSKRKEAIELYLGTELPLKVISDKTGIHKNDIYRLLKRCLSANGNQKIMGYKGLIPFVQTTSYTRQKQNNNQSETNYSGSFNFLLNEYPQLNEFLIQEYFNIAKKKNSARELKISYKNIHRKFLSECRKCGVKPTEYPFNTISLAKKSVERFLKELSNSYFREIAKNNGGQSLMVLNNVNNTSNSNTNILRPLERVEFDGHKIDAIISIEYITAAGDKIVDILDRLWILTLVDVATRCVIGYHLSLRKEYNSNDIKECFQSAIIPWKPKELKIPGLHYKKEGGFPSSNFIEAEYAIWNEISYDNAKAHLSNEIKDLLQKYIGCSINMGPVGVPVRRPIIEKFFKTLEENTFHRLPSTTGSNVMDPKRNNAEKNAIKFSITYEAIEELCDVIIANYNATPHDSLNGFTPLEIFKSRLEQGHTIVKMPESQRKQVNLFPVTKDCIVKGNIENGRRPYIHYKNVRYTSPDLGNDFSMVNEKIKIVINTDDLRTIEAYKSDGTRYGILRAAGQWGITPHNLKTRDAINKFKRLRYFKYTETDDPIDAFQHFLEQRAISDKSLRNLLAENIQYRKKYSVQSVNEERKKKKKNIEKLQEQVQQTIINEIKLTPQKNSLSEKQDLSIHEIVMQEKLKEKDFKNVSLNTNITEENYFEHMIADEKRKTSKKRRSINL